MSLKVTCERCCSEIEHICTKNLVGAIVDLYEFRPEVGFPKSKDINSYKDENVDSDEVPFLSETYLYALLGKEDARTLMALVNHVVREAGHEPSFLQGKAHRILEEKKKEKERLEEIRANRKKAILEEALKSK